MFQVETRFGLDPPIARVYPKATMCVRIPYLRQASLSLLSTTILFGFAFACAKKEAAPETTAPPVSARSFSQVGPTGGIISAVKFHPTRAGEVWACGDDGGGIYKSTDSGATFTNINVGTLNHSCYAIEFDPTNANRMYIPSHFGRGLLKSVDAGVTWTLTQAGLPIFGDARQRV